MSRSYIGAGQTLGLFLLLFLGTSCQSKSIKTDELQDRYNKGTIHISCDESFKPVIDAQVQVYEGLYPETKIIVHYKPEAECFRDFAVDSVRMVIATRGASEAENNLMVDSLHVGPEQLTIAHGL